jgi:two-component system, NarL family, sensor kinase
MADQPVQEDRENPEAVGIIPVEGAAALEPEPEGAAYAAAMRAPPRARNGAAPSLAAAPTLVAAGVETEALLRSTLDALSAHVAVLDPTGTIVAVNSAWRIFAQTSGYVGEDHGVGTNYLEVCERAAETSPEAAATAVALRELIAGRRRDFRMEYPCLGPDGQRWFQLRITCPDRPELLRIVIAHEDITEVKRAHEELARLTGRLMNLQDQERRSIARELHDTTAQNLLAVSLNVARMRERLRNGTPPTDRILTETLDLVEQSLQEVRTLSYLLHPPLLDVAGLGSALRWLAKGFSERCGIAVEAAIEEGADELPQEAATTLYRVAQECLANVHRHSGSAWARIALARAAGAVRLDVVDGGGGLAAASDPGEAALGVGLSSMRFRLAQLEGRLQIESGPVGTRVTATVPVAP